MQAPPSKSSMQRACAAALLHKGTTLLSNAGDSNDERAALEIIQQLGAVVTQTISGAISIRSDFDFFAQQTDAEPLPINCGESALCARLFTPIAARCSRTVTLTGEGTLLKRNLHFPAAVFREIGISIDESNCRLPITVRGPLQPIPVHVQAEESSQHLTGLLFAYASSVKIPTTITVRALSSKPYVDLTVDVLSRFGYRIDETVGDSYVVHPGNNMNNTEASYNVEGDWSTAAFFLTGAAISGHLTLTGLDVFSKQADRAILQALMMTGVPLSITENHIKVGGITGSSGLNPFHFNATDCPDLFPPLAVLAACCNGTSVIEGTGRLGNKESNRKETIADLLGRMGISVTLQDDLMIIEGRQELNAVTVDSFQDHRIAMAAAIGALRANGPVVLEQADAVNKSFPAFFEQLDKLRSP